jgi:hypothetical protein
MRIGTPQGSPSPSTSTPYRTPTDGELREAVRELTNGRAGGASGMRAEDVKAWLRGVQLEEDPKDGLANVTKGKGDNWRLFKSLFGSTVKSLLNSAG